MRRNLLKTTVIIASLFIAINTNAQWDDLNAPSAVSPDNYQYFKLAVSADGKNIASYCSKLQIDPFLMENWYVVSNNYGTSWSEYPAPANSSPNDMFWEGDDLFVKLPMDSTLKKSTDFGASFTNQNSDFFSTTMAENILRSPNNNWYLVKNVTITQFNIFESPDKGVTWNDLGAVSVSANPNFFRYLVADNGNIVATSVAGTSYSTDNGLTWTASSYPSGITVNMSNSLSIADDGTIIFFEWAQKRLYISNDNGENFSFVNSSNLSETLNRCGYYKNDLIGVCSDGSTVKSSDNGSSFTQLTAAGELLASSDIMEESNSAIFIAGINKIYRYGGQTSSVNEIIDFSNNINIYPNPTQSILNIKVNEITSIKIVDVLGKVVSTQQLNIGNNSIYVEALTNGAYFLQTDKGEVVKFIKE